MNKKNAVFYGIVLLALIIILTTSIIHIHDQKKHLQEYKTWKAQDIKFIEGWMPLGFVLKEFELDKTQVLDILEVKNSFGIERYSINELCDKSNVDCTEKISELNNLLR